MSRIGKKPIPIPKGVTVKIAPDAVEVQGPKGKMRQIVPPGILFAQDDGALVAKLSREDPELGKFHGLARSLVANAVAGVTDGFKKELDIVGVGYRAEHKGKQVVFALGYSHPVVYDIPMGSRSPWTSRPTSPSPVWIVSSWARSQPTSAGCGSRIPTSRRAFAIPASS
jgi:large subunit ribosomal protein L6